MLASGCGTVRVAQIGLNTRDTKLVMPGLVPGIHVLTVLTVLKQERRGWPGRARTSPAMTTGHDEKRLRWLGPKGREARARKFKTDHWLIQGRNRPAPDAGSGSV